MKGQIIGTRSWHLGAQNGLENGLDKDGLCAGPIRVLTKVLWYFIKRLHTQWTRWGVCFISVIPFYWLNLSNLSLHMLSFSSKVPWLAVNVLSEEVTLLENTEHSCIGLWSLQSMLIKFLVTAKCHLKYTGVFCCLCWRSLSVFVNCESARLVWRKGNKGLGLFVFFPVLLMSGWFLKYFSKRNYWRFDWRLSLVIKLEVCACKLKTCISSWLSLLQ